MEQSNTLERKCHELEQELEYYRRQLDTVIRNVPDIVYLLDSDGNIDFISGNIARYGYRPHQLIGTPIIELIHPEDRKKAMYRINERRTGERKTTAFEVKLLTGSKDTVHMEINTCTVDGGAPKVTVTAEGYYLYPKDEKRQFKGTVGIARDISLRSNLADSVSTALRTWNRSPNYLPICSNCKRYRDTSGEWHSIEMFFEECLNLQLTHTICLDCSTTLYPDLID